MSGHVAEAKVHVDASPERVWTALTEPDEVRAWMAGTDLRTDWEVGGPVTWSGEMDGKPYEDKGEVLEVERPRRLAMTHYSPLMGQEDRPENYHRVEYELAPDGDGTALTLRQDGNASAEQAGQFSSAWQQMLDALKSRVESG